MHTKDLEFSAFPNKRDVKFPKLQAKTLLVAVQNYRPTALSPITAELRLA
jgi:hypothetical protein